MNLVIPDLYLQNQICTQCKLYLSCGPVKSYGNGNIYEVKCGRCSRDDDNGAFSQFNVIAENALFPCINRFEGCNLILPFNETVEHEKTCLGSRIPCPVCEDPAKTYVPLALTNHFRSNHWKNSLSEPTIRLSDEINQYFVYSEKSTNLFVLIHVRANERSLEFKVMSSKMNRVEYRISIFKGHDQHSEIFGSNPISSLDFDENCEGYKVPKNLTGHCQGLCCKFLLRVAHRMQRMQTGKNPPLQPEEEVSEEEIPNHVRIVGYQEQSTQLPARNLPEIFLDDAFKMKFGNTHLTSFDLSQDENSLVDRESGLSVLITCNYCENYLAVAGRIIKVFFCANCSYSICGQCSSYGVEKTCPRCRIPQLKSSGELARHYSLNFYCKFQCGRYFKAWDLLDHEDRCALNVYRGLSDEENILLYFGETMQEHDTFQRSNSVYFDRSKFSRDGRIFVATRDDVRFMIEYRYDKSKALCRYAVKHKYKNVHVVVNVCEHEKFRETFPEFCIDLKVNFAFFVVILRSLPYASIE